jgi:hypothetical protein
MIPYFLSKFRKLNVSKTSSNWSLISLRKHKFYNFHWHQSWGSLRSLYKVRQLLVIRHRTNVKLGTRSARVTTESGQKRWVKGTVEEAESRQGQRDIVGTDKDLCKWETASNEKQRQLAQRGVCTVEEHARDQSSRHEETEKLAELERNSPEETFIQQDLEHGAT